MPTWTRGRKQMAASHPVLVIMPDDLVAKLDEVAGNKEISRSLLIREACKQLLAGASA